MLPLHTAEMPGTCNFALLILDAWLLHNHAYIQMKNEVGRDAKKTRGPSILFEQFSDQAHQQWVVLIRVVSNKTYNTSTPPTFETIYSRHGLVGLV